MNQKLIIIFSALLLSPLICAACISTVRYFMGIRESIKYINMEIERTSGKERKYWKKEKRKLIFGFLFLYK